MGHHRGSNMIDNLCILFSLSIVGYVIVRAAMLDTRRPWFEKVADATPPPKPASRLSRWR